MASTKFWHITVLQRVKNADGKTEGKTVFQKQCVSVGEANKLKKEKQEEYKGSDFMILKEQF